MGLVSHLILTLLKGTADTVYSYGSIHNSFNKPWSSNNEEYIVVYLSGKTLNSDNFLFSLISDRSTVNWINEF